MPCPTCLAPRGADGSLNVAVRPGATEWLSTLPDLTINSAGLCRGLFEIYLGSSSGG